MKQFSNVISWVFNPLLLPILALALVMYVPSDHIYHNPYCMYNIQNARKIYMLIYFFVFGGVMPLISFYFLWKYKIIDSIEMETQKERSIPIIVMFFYCMLIFVRFYSDSIGVDFHPKYLVTLPLSGVVVTFIFFFLNRWKKVSIHAAGCGILVGFLFSYIDDHADYELWIIALAFIISGLVMSARLYLKKHSLEELVIGWIVGSFITFGVGLLF